MRRVRMRRLWLVASLLVGLALAAVVGLSVLLGTAADRAIVVRQVLAAANRHLAGRIELQRAWLFPNGHLIARDVAIYDPEGAVIIRAATVDTHVDLWALARRRLHLTGTQVGGAALFFATDARGDLNIARAFGSRTPASSPPPLPGPAVAESGFVVDIDGAKVAIDDARFEAVAELRNAVLRGSFRRAADGEMAIDARQLDADVRAPVEGPLHLIASLGIKDSELRVSTTAAVDDASLTAQLDLNVATYRGRGVLTTCSLGTHFLSAWLPGLEARGVFGNATVELEAGSVHLLSLEARPIEGRGVIHVMGALDLKAGSAVAHLRAGDLDARALSTRLPSTSAAFEVDAQADQIFRRPRRMSAHLVLGSSGLAGQRIGPGTLEARLEGETVTVSRFDLSVPGAHVLGSGSLAGRRVAATVQVDAFDLPQLRMAFEELTGMHLPHFTGRLSSQVELAGSLAAPTFRAELRAPHLFLNGLEAAQVEAHVEAPRLGRQMEVRGTATLGDLRAADRSLQDVAISVAWNTPDLHLEARAHERGQEIALVGDAVLPPDLDSGTLSALELRVPGDAWRLVHPAAVDFRRGIAFDRLELSADPQRLSVSVDVRAHALHASLEVEALDLSRLPGPLSLWGRVAGVARYQEEAGTRAGSLDLTATGLAYQGIEASTARAKVAMDGERITAAASCSGLLGVLATPLTVTLEASLDSRHLEQSLRVEAGETRLLALTGTATLTWEDVRGTLAVPSKLLPLLSSLHFDEHLDLVDVPLGPLARHFPRAPGTEGTLSGRAHLVGPASDPHGELALTAHHLEYDHRALGELQLRLNADGKRFDANVEVRPPRGRLTASARWELLPGLLKSPDARQAATLTAELRGSDLPISAVLGEASALQGLVDLTASFHGSLGHPQGRAQLSLRELQVHQVPSGELVAEASWDGARLESTLTGHQPQGGRVTGHAALPLTLERALRDPPLTADLDAVGFDLGALSAFSTRGGSLRAIAGRLDAHLRLDGTLRSPRPRGLLSLSQGELALAGLGQLSAIAAQLDIRPDGADIRRISATSASGTFLVTGTLRRPDARGVAIQAHIDTDRFGVYASDRLIGLLSSSEDLSGLVDVARTDLTLTVRRAELRLPQLVPKSLGPTSIDSDIVLGTERPTPTRRAGAYPLDIHVIAQDSLRLQATDVSLKARADLLISIQGDAEMRGSVISTGGEVNAYGRRFEIEHARLTFGHGQELGAANDPDIDARAAEAIGIYHLFIDVTGHPRNLRIVSSSEPPLDKERVGLLLVTGSADSLDGHPSPGSTQSGGLAAASAFGGLLSEKLRESLGPYMPLDVLTVEPSRLEAGKRITPELYLGAVQNLGAIDPRVNGAEIHANYKLTLHWSLDSRYGTARAGNLDLQWTRNW
jgi:hypothetical protein